MKARRGRPVLTAHPYRAVPEPVHPAVDFADHHDDLLDFIRAEIVNEQAWRREPTSVYLMFGREHEPLYVGMTRSLIQRIPAHAAHKDWFHEVAYILHEHYRNRDAARRREAFLIGMLRPTHNRAGGSYTLGRDDKIARAMQLYMDKFSRPPLGAWAMDDDLPDGVGGFSYRNIRRVEAFRPASGILRTSAAA